MKHKKHVHMISVVIILIGAFLIIRSAIVGQIRTNIKDADFQEDALQAQAGCTPPTLTNIHVENISNNGASIVWTTNQQSTSAVRLGLSSNSMSWLSTIHTPASSSGVTMHSYPLSNLQAGRTYYYRVRSSNGTCQKTSPTYSFATITAPTGTPDVTMPSTPTNLAATNLTPTGVVIVWNASTDPVVTGAITSGVKGYELYGPTSACAYGGSPGYCGNILHTGAASYSMSIQGLTPGNTYTGAVGTTAGFALKAYDNAGNYSSATSRLTVVAPSADLCPNIAGVQLTVPTDMIIDLNGNCVLPPDSIAPSTPTGLTSPAKTATSVSLAWNASTDNSGSVSGYRVYVNGSSAAANTSLITSTTYTVTGLSAATPYTFNVKAFDAAGNASNASAALSVTTTTIPDTAAPSRPTGLTTSNITSSSFVLSWTPSTDDTLAASQINYDIYGSNQACNVNAIAGYCGSVTGATSKTISGLSPSTTYSASSGNNAGFVVQAYDNTNHYSTASTRLTVTTIAGSDTTPPTISNLSVSATSSNATVTWTTNEAATTYVDYGPTTAYGQVVNNTTLSLPHTGILTGLVAGNTYHYRVKSTDAAGNTATSPDVTFVAQAGPMACANASSTGYEKAMWVWKKNTEVVTAGSTEQNNLFAFVAANDIQRIYLYANKSTLAGSTFSNNLKTFLNTAWNTHCLKVELLDGASNWVVTDNTYVNGPATSGAIDWVNAAIAFNNSITGSNVKLAGLHLDVEPHGFVRGDYPGYTPYWSGTDANGNPPNSVLVSKAYIKMLQAVEDRMVGTGLAMAVDVPRWYDTSSSLVAINYGGVTKNLMQHVFDRVDELGIMDYVVNSNEIYSDAINELNYAMQLGKKVTIGVETIDLTSYGGGNGSTSFWTKPCSDLTAALNATHYSVGFNNKLPGFNRFAVHAYWNDKNGVMSGYKYLCQ